MHRYMQSWTNYSAEGEQGSFTFNGRVIRFQLDSFGNFGSLIFSSPSFSFFFSSHSLAEGENDLGKF